MAKSSFEFVLTRKLGGTSYVMPVQKKDQAKPKAEERYDGKKR
jgi:hypothetical protein